MALLNNLQVTTGNVQIAAWVTPKGATSPEYDIWGKSSPYTNMFTVPLSNNIPVNQSQHTSVNLVAGTKYTVFVQLFINSTSWTTSATNHRVTFQFDSP
jgi:hypothetical protein